MEALERDYTTALITAQERVMLDYVVKLTKDATRVGKEDHDRLRAAGFDDRGILADHADCRLVQLHQPGGGRAGGGEGLRAASRRGFFVAQASWSKESDGLDRSLEIGTAGDLRLGDFGKECGGALAA